MPKTSKASGAQFEDRVNRVFELLLRGMSRRTLLQYVAEKTDWEVAERTIDSYIAEATRLMVELGKTKREEELGRAIGRLNQLYYQASEGQDFKACLAIQKEINKLLGLSLEENILTRIEALEQLSADR